MCKCKVGDRVRYYGSVRQLTYIKPCLCGHLYFSFNIKPHTHEYICDCGERVRLEYVCSTMGAQSLSSLVDEITYLKQLEDL